MPQGHVIFLAPAEFEIFQGFLALNLALVVTEIFMYRDWVPVECNIKFWQVASGQWLDIKLTGQRPHEFTRFIYVFLAWIK